MRIGGINNYYNPYLRSQATNKATETNNPKETDEEYVQRVLNPEGKKYPNTQNALSNGKYKQEVIDYYEVVKVLPDDTSGIKHQLFYVRSPQGIIVKVAHNISVAPRIPNLRPGMKLAIKGELINLDLYSSELPDIDDDELNLVQKIVRKDELGKIRAVLHWTHHDPRGKHIDGGIVVLSKGPNYRKVIR